CAANFGSVAMVTSCWLGTCFWTVPHPEAAYRFRLRWADEALCRFPACWSAHRQLVTTGWASVMAHNHARFSDAERCGSAAPESGSAADAGRRRLQPVVRCSAAVEERPLGFLAQESCAYGQSRGVIPFSCAYLAADASTSGRTS